MLSSVKPRAKRWNRLAPKSDPFWTWSCPCRAMRALCSAAAADCPGRVRRGRPGKHAPRGSAQTGPLIGPTQAAALSVWGAKARNRTKTFLRLLWDLRERKKGGREGSFLTWLIGDAFKFLVLFNGNVWNPYVEKLSFSIFSCLKT